MNEQIKQRIVQLNNGEVPSGYEKTEFGVFPCDWAKDKTFGDLFDFYGGLGKSRDELGDEGHAYLHYGDLHRGAFNMVSHKQYEQLPKYDATLKGNETYLMKDGDVAFLDASEDLEGTSRAVVIDNPDNEPFVAGLHIIYGKSKDDSLDKWYKQYITLPESVRKQFQKLAVGFKVYGLNRETLPKIHLAYPESTAEQSKIAEILMKWDEAIELQEEHIQKLTKRNKAIINSLIAPQAHWKSVKIRDVFEITRGQVLSTTKCNPSGTYPVYSSQTANDGLMGYYDQYLFEDCITWTTDGANAGDVNFRKGKFYCTNVCGVLINNQGYANLCMAHIIGKVSKNYVSYVGNPKLMNNTMGIITVQLPPLNVQEKVSEIIETLTREIQLHNEEKQKLILQRKALQQYLLNGIVRVEK